MLDLITVGGIIYDAYEVGHNHQDLEHNMRLLPLCNFWGV